ncbi:MAG: transposase [Salinivirgaceae bacterium]
MTYDPVKHHLRSIRLKGYDYSQAGLYFITICTQNRSCLFGKIENGEMILNDAGIMVKKWYYELENKYPDKRCHEMVVMPNHFHCIIENISTNATMMDARVGAPLRGHPENNERRRPENDERGRSDNNYGIDNIKYKATIGDAMDWYKTMTTNEYIRGVKKNNWQPFDKKIWQRNYYEHIIRNEQSYRKISEYIINNPANWDNDTLK